MKRHDDVVLVCADDNPEKRLIQLMAYRIGMTVIRSGQRHFGGADHDPGLFELVIATGKEEVWIVELPGPRTEQKLMNAGKRVSIIDCHDYGTLNRSFAIVGDRLPSSLEQFLLMAGVELVKRAFYDFEAKISLGVGILNHRSARGLRDEHYSKDEIAQVLTLHRKLSLQIDPNFEQAERIALQVWGKRRPMYEFLLVESSHPHRIRSIITHLMIACECDTLPVIISELDGARIFFQNLTPDLIKRLQIHIRDSHTFVYDGGQSWGIDNAKGGTTYSVNEILTLLLIH